jgi:hypothetical protein
VAALAPPDFAGGPQPEPQGPGGGQASPAPPTANPEAVQTLELVRNIVSSARLLAQKVPAASDIVRQINDLAQKLQMKIIQSGPTQEPQAPPM